MAALIPGGQLSEDGTAIVVRITAGTPETGIWCGRCLLPSGVCVPIYIFTEEGPQRWAWGDYRACEDCGGRV